MQGTLHSAQAQAAAKEHDTAIFVALELSKASWLIAINAPGSDKVSRYVVAPADTAALMVIFTRVQAQVERWCGATARIVAIHEAGLDGFWLHRWLEAHRIESHVVDPASIAVDRRSRRVKTDRIDVEKLLRALMAWARGERRICSMVHPPSPQQEDERRLTRERESLVAERTRHVNRIKGLLATQGISGFEPMRRDRRKRFEALRCWDERPLPRRLKAELVRELDRLEMVIAQIAVIEAERNLALEEEQPVRAGSSIGATLIRLKGIGPEIASVLRLEAFCRTFKNRREVAAYAGLAPSPWKSGNIDVDQGISKAGNPRLRRTMIQLAWLWLRHQPGSALSRWFHDRVGERRGRIRRITIVAVARKLLIALWRYITHGLVPEGAQV
jgi:transposase